VNVTVGPSKRTRTVPGLRLRCFSTISSAFSLSPAGSGTGLGLIISNRIIADRHGGEIEFESKPGETRFKVRLPLVRAPAKTNPA